MGNNRQLEQAKRLIEKKKYAAARRILLKIDDPTARNLINEIDEITQNGSNRVHIPNVKTEHSRRRSIFVWLLLACGGLFFISLGLQALGIIPSAEEQRATESAIAQVAQANTETAEASVTPTATQTPGPTYTPSLSPTITDTPTTTNTPLPTQTPDPELLIQAIIDDVVRTDIRDILYNPSVPAIVASWNMSQGFSGYEVEYTEREFLRLTCALKESGLTDEYRFVFSAFIDVIDRFGNESSINGFTVTFEPDIIQQINCENVGLLDIQNLVSAYDLNPLLQDN